jgi:hypothetical protein
MTFDQFRQLLTNLSILLDDQPRPSAHNKNESGPIPSDEDGDPNTVSWWQARQKAANAQTPRTKAFLLAYVAVAGSGIPARGIELDDGWVHPDRGIMKAMLQNGYLSFVGGEASTFEVTPNGRSLLLGAGG